MENFISNIMMKYNNFSLLLGDLNINANNNLKNENIQYIFQKFCK
jgi:hypothetical protein